MSLKTLANKLKGGPGSGHFGHGGRPGQRGGSSSGIGRSTNTALRILNSRPVIEVHPVDGPEIKNVIEHMSHAVWDKLKAEKNLNFTKAQDINVNPNTSNIKSNRPGLTQRKLARFIEDFKPRSTGDLPQVFKYKDLMLVMDGNHRMAAAKLLGKSIKATIYEFE